jgi:hypothetical protein
MLWGAKMKFYDLRSEADKPAKAYKTTFAPNNIHYFFFKPS